MVVPRLALVRPVRARAQPVEVRAEPLPHPAGVVRRPAGRALDESDSIDRLDEPARVDDAAAAFPIDATHELREAEVRRHPRRRVEEPGAQLPGGTTGVCLVAAEVIGERERLEIPSQRGNAWLVEIPLTLGIRLAITSYVRQTVRLARVRPPVGAQAEVVVPVVARRQQRVLVRDGEERRAHRLVGLTLQRLERGQDRWVTGTYQRARLFELVRAQCESAR